MGGIGKTELAYAAAQQLNDTFPDAQLLVELRGATSNPLPLAQALQTLIRAFEREARLPDDLSELRNIYCSVLAGKHALILADDAKDAAQVRALLPPMGCALLVTSRNWFSVPGMAALDLGTLPPQEAEKLLLKICPRIGEQASTLAKLCGYLPLGLRVSASLLANSSRSVAHYLEQLAAERLKHLSDPDDPQASVEASLRLSYDALEGAAQAALAQMSVFAASFDLAAASAVLEVEGDAEALVDLLVRRSLLEWDEQLQRYSLHELVRAFAAARLENADAVRLRYASHYAQVAWRAGGELYNQGGTHLLAGLALFDQERPHIDAGWGWAIAHADNHSNNQLIYDYANAVLPYIGDLRYNTRRERIPHLEAQLAAARRLGNRRGEGQALGNLGIAYANLGDAHTAIDFFEQDLVVARESGDRRGEGQALGNLGVAYASLGDAHKASDFHEQALVIEREIGDRRGEGAALGNLGVAYASLGDAQKASDFYEQRLGIAREIGDRRGEGNALGNLGNAYAALGDAGKASDFYEQHLAVAREIGDRRGEAMASWNLGLALEKQGDLARAAELMQVCVDYEREIGHADAEKDATQLEQLRQRLADGDGAPAAGEPA